MAMPAPDCPCARCAVDRELRAAGHDPQLLLSRERTAEVLGGISVDLVDQLYHVGKLAGMAIGRRRFHSVQAIERFIADNEGYFGD